MTRGRCSDKERQQLRDGLLEQGHTTEQIAAAMIRQCGERPRAAWRYAHGWTQEMVAARFNKEARDPQASMTGSRIGDFERWPQGRVAKPTVPTLATLAQIYSTQAAKLLDSHDRKKLSLKELIALNAVDPAPTGNDPSIADTPPRSPSTSTDNHTTVPGVNISVAISHLGHEPKTPPPSTNYRKRVALWALLMIILAAGGASITWIVATGSSPVTADRIPTPPAQTSAPPATSKPSSVLPSRLPPLSPPAQQTIRPPQRPEPVVPPAHTRTPVPGQPDPLPPPAEPIEPPVTEPPLDDARPFVTTGSVTWQNVGNHMCLDEEQESTGRDPANIQTWDCNGTPNQIWSEKTIAANPGSPAKNLVSANTERCITYRPGDDRDHAQVWLTPCGKEGQGWLRVIHGDTVTFEAGEVRGMCMAATAGPVAGNFIGIELRPCGISPLMTWKPY